MAPDPGVTHQEGSIKETLFPVDCRELLPTAVYESVWVIRGFGHCVKLIVGYFKMMGMYETDYRTLSVRNKDRERDRSRRNKLWKREGKEDVGPSYC